MHATQHPTLEVAWPPRAGRALAALEAEFAQLSAGVSRIAADPSSPWPRDMLQRLKVDLFLTASLLLRLWRELCIDPIAVDRDEVLLIQMRELADLCIERGEDDPLARARLAVLAEGLARHRQRAGVLLRALEVVVDPGRIAALVSDWQAQRAQLMQSLARGERAAFENEDADPVGPIPA